jgi:hypothetical protein
MAGQMEEKYAGFRDYDETCTEEVVLFCKLLFVADKDSIVATLGKRCIGPQEDCPRFFACMA